MRGSLRGQSGCGAALGSPPPLRSGVDVGRRPHTHTHARTQTHGLPHAVHAAVSVGDGTPGRMKASSFVPVCTAACLLVGSTSLFFVFT